MDNSLEVIPLIDPFAYPVFGFFHLSYLYSLLALTFVKSVLWVFCFSTAIPTPLWANPVF